MCRAKSLMRFLPSPSNTPLLLIAILGVVLSVPTGARAAEDYTFGDWAVGAGYSSGAAMPASVRADFTDPKITGLDGIDNYTWTATTTLSMQGGLVSSIDSGTFSAMENLENLWLHYNNISSVESGDFAGLTKLTYLELYANQVSSIGSGAFSELSSLSHLYLGDNKISSIESSHFTGLANLNELHLYTNQISSINSGTFSTMTSLTGLFLYDNEISSIESGDFSGLSNLSYMELQNNQISSIESNDFSGLSNLTYLNLQNNQISNIESDAFSGLAGLAYLYLGDNPISNIESGAFSNMTNLESLRLGGNTSITDLNLDGADFSSLTRTSFGREIGWDTSVTSVSLKNAVLNQTSLEALLDGGSSSTAFKGIGQLSGITELDLSGVDFSQISSLAPLHAMDDVTDLRLVGVSNISAAQLDALLDEMATMQGTVTEGILYLTQADYDVLNTAGGGMLAAWDAESGHHVQIAFPTDTDIPAEAGAEGSVGGGSGLTGGVDVVFDNVSSGGTFSAEFSEIAVGDLDQEAIDALTFLLPGDPFQSWAVSFDGTFDSLVTLTFGYDDSNLTMPEESLLILHHSGGEWEMLPVIARDMDANTITVTTTGFSTFALGAIPEPATLSLLALGGLAILRRRRRGA
ncbi:MAG: leucine-rich repeat protein [Phycisphaerae bacterium]|nr:leucine-rich repeat protein [Phycisphaerae bacterium]